MLRLPAALLLTATCALLAWAYAPGINGPAMLDDISSVVILDQLAENPEYASGSLLRDASGPLGRPLSVATFALERAYAGGGLALSKAVNIALHLSNLLLLCVLLQMLLRPIAERRALWIAILAAGLWACLPMFVSTVLYTVQRMAMLATCFSLLSLITYLVWRRRFVAGDNAYGLLALLCLLLVAGLFAKETAAVTLPLLGLLELLWFRCQASDRERTAHLQRLVLAVASASLLGLLLTLALLPGLLTSDRIVNYTPISRLLTETVVLWDYLRQLVWPDLARLGLYHDDWMIPRDLSTDRRIWLGTGCWLAVGALLTAICRWPSGSKIAFCVLFFLTGHAIESTVFPLELYFEHRNYFPAVGLALLLGVVLAQLARAAPQVLSPLLAYLFCAQLIYLGATSSQVQIWSSQSLLRLQHIIGHPDSYRANADMSLELAAVGALDHAIVYSNRAHELAAHERAGDLQLRNLLLACIAQAEVSDGLMDDVTAAFGAGEPIRDINIFRVLLNQLQAGTCSTVDWPRVADSLARSYLEGEPLDAPAHYVYSPLAIMENALGRYDNAHAYTQRYLRASPDNVRALLMQLQFTTVTGRLDEAQALKQRLMVLGERGVLNRQERDTLDLYRSE